MKNLFLLIVLSVMLSLSACVVAFNSGDGTIHVNDNSKDDATAAKQAVEAGVDAVKIVVP